MRTEPVIAPSKPQPRIPPWIRTYAPGGPQYIQLKDLAQRLKLHTVCEEAKCPNLGECWSHGTATFMLMGDVCTRRCHFCSVGKGRPTDLDPLESDHVAEAVEALNLRHVVLTSVDRDDLPDQGSHHFAQTIVAIAKRAPNCRIESLIPDFRGDTDCIACIVNTPLAVLAHNIETVPRLYRPVRPGSDYNRSLRVLSVARNLRPDIITKSSLMLGLGETNDEVIAVARDLRRHDCNILTLGQYLRPSPRELPVQRFLSPDEFDALRAATLPLGFRHVEAGPLVRSSYHAWEHVR